MLVGHAVSFLVDSWTKGCVEKFSGKARFELVLNLKREFFQPPKSFKNEDVPSLK